jgi:putative ABC transport system permease protein
MSEYQIFQILSEGLIFAFVALGIYVAFVWLRFPDLTPDGSFALGAAVFATAVNKGVTPFTALVVSFVAGAAAGSFTTFLNRTVRIPSVVAGLLVASSLYSISWLLMKRPNQFVDPGNTLIGDISGLAGVRDMAAWICALLFISSIFLWVLSQTIWGLRMRAIGENPLLAHDLGLSLSKYTLGGLALANGLVAVAGALFAQRSFSADINMGVGITIAGLAGLLLGLVIAGQNASNMAVIGFVIVGAVAYKFVFFISLELGIPPESFRLISSSVLIIVFLCFSRAAMDVLRGLKWS